MVLESGLQVSTSRLFFVDRHFIRRQPRAVHERRKANGVRGVARDCGSNCHLRLRSDDVVYTVHLHRWRQLPVPHNKSLPVVENADVVPLVQYMESESSTRARLSHVTGDCIYRAQVADAKDSSIVNLCDSHNVFCCYASLPINPKVGCMQHDRAVIRELVKKELYKEV
ncbi:hypothetical protein DICVIV_09583 [Dictyocaulus viviparus]|uniref:Uncharacterized protein n=1 Tax=Dictyocaulus viviparus TaxID=29172 RepID=A0A0D8XIB7_DICVI|nr:hypothetical protein DICVIV_09583 [Dictyocaulus viviparus]